MDRCVVCNEIAAYSCFDCEKFFYCSKKCQRKHWDQQGHKFDCHFTKKQDMVEVVDVKQPYWSTKKGYSIVKYRNTWRRRVNTTAIFIGGYKKSLRIKDLKLNRLVVDSYYSEESGYFKQAEILDDLFLVVLIIKPSSKRPSKLRIYHLDYSQMPFPFLEIESGDGIGLKITELNQTPSSKFKEKIRISSNYGIQRFAISGRKLYMMSRRNIIIYDYIKNKFEQKIIDPFFEYINGFKIFDNRLIILGSGFLFISKPKDFSNREHIIKVPKNFELNHVRFIDNYLIIGIKDVMRVYYLDKERREIYNFKIGDNFSKNFKISISNDKKYLILQIFNDKSLEIYNLNFRNKTVVKIQQVNKLYLRDQIGRFVFNFKEFSSLSGKLIDVVKKRDNIEVYKEDFLNIHLVHDFPFKKKYKKRTSRFLDIFEDTTIFQKIGKGLKILKLLCSKPIEYEYFIETNIETEELLNVMFGIEDIVAEKMKDYLNLFEQLNLEKEKEAVLNGIYRLPKKTAAKFNLKRPKQGSKLTDFNKLYNERLIELYNDKISYNLNIKVQDDITIKAGHVEILCLEHEGFMTIFEFQKIEGKFNIKNMSFKLDLKEKDIEPFLQMIYLNEFDKNTFSFDIAKRLSIFNHHYNEVEKNKSLSFLFLRPFVEISNKLNSEMAGLSWELGKTRKKSKREEIKNKIEKLKDEYETYKEQEKD